MKRLAVLLAALAVTPSAAAEPPASGVVHVQVPPGTPLVELGRQLYAGNCATCHGGVGEGITTPGRGAGDVTGLGPSLQGVGAQAADFYLRTGYMPLGNPHDQPRRSRVLFSQRELRALVAYIASLRPGPAVPTPQPSAGNLEEGLKLFTEHCSGCHQVVAQGGYVTGAVAPPLQKATAVQVAEAVRIGPYLMPRFSKRQISDRQLDSIVRYVEYTKHPHDVGGWGIGHIGPVPEGLVNWFIGIALVVATCVVIGKRLES
jgi:ubiquinol-cytochrome c reductase cytochrome c subunit